MTEQPTNWIFFLLFPVALVVALTARYWRFVVQWFEGIRGRDWAIISALIDVVSTVVQTEQGRYGERVIGYLATLTYFYRNPDLQMGEYSRMFDDESEAQAWAASYKGRTVMVHVDPRDPSRSVLRKEDL
jgi:Protein of unknown function (DUF3592)